MRPREEGWTQFGSPAASLSSLLHDPKTAPFPKANRAGLAFRVVGDGQFHCGILCGLDELDAVLHVHLAWHKRLQREVPTEDDLWTDVPDLIPEEKTLLAVTAERIGRRSPHLPYSFARGSIKFTDEGEVEDSRVGRGFTCATFVVAVFEHLGIDLVVEETWPENANPAWQKSVVEQLDASHAHPLHVRAVREQLGARRVRPEETVGAGANTPLPKSFQDVQPLAAQVVAEAQAILAARA